MRRIAGMVLFVGLVVAPGCSRRVPASANDAGAGAGPDAFSSGDAGPHDANMVLPDVSAPVDAHVDSSTGHDASATHDAAAAPDAPTSGCAAPVDVSAGGTFMLDTCAGSDHFTSACGTAGAHDVIVSATETGSGTTIQIVGDTGWLIQQLSFTCDPGIGGISSCSTTGTWSESGSDGHPRFFWGIERIDGSCESVQIMVTRSP
jgi:hypothetical protein